MRNAAALRTPPGRTGSRAPAQVLAPFLTLALAFAGPLLASVAAAPRAAQGGVAYVRAGEPQIESYAGTFSPAPSVSPGTATWQMGSYWVGLPDGTHTITWDAPPERLEGGRTYAVTFQASSSFPNGTGSRHPSEIPFLGAYLWVEGPFVDLTPSDQKRAVAAAGGFVDAVPSATHSFRLKDEAEILGYPDAVDVEVRVNGENCFGSGCGSWAFGVHYRYTRVAAPDGCQAPAGRGEAPVAALLGGRGSVVRGVRPEEDSGCPIDLRIDRIEAVQVIQDDAASIVLVANKKTVARVFVAYDNNPPRTISGVTVKLTARQNGRPVDGRGVPLNEPLSVPVQWRREEANDSLNFLLPAEWTAPGTLELVATLNVPGGLEDLNEANNTRTSDPFQFVERSSLRVAWAPMCYVPKPAPGTSGVPGRTAATGAGCAKGSLDTMGDTIRRLYPIADDGLQLSQVLALQWAWHTPLRDERGIDRFRVFLRRAYLVAVLLSYGFEGEVPDQFVALVPAVDETIGIAGGASDPSFLFGSGDWRTSHTAWVLDRTATAPAEVSAALAHEIGHNLGLRHPGTSYPGCSQAEDTGTYWPPERAGRIGVLGFNIDSGQVIPPDRPDLMTHCPPERTWIADIQYRRLFDANMRPPQASAGRGLVASVGGGFLRASGAGLVQPWVVVSGSVRADGSSGTIDPVTVVQSGISPTAASPSGDQCLVITAASGDILATECFSLGFVDEGGNALDEQAFSLALPLPAEAAGLALVRDDRALAAIDAAPGPPVVSVGGVAAGEAVQGIRVVSWSASAAAGPVSYTAAMSTDGRLWYPLTLDPTDTSATIDTTGLTSDQTVTLRVVATAGVSSAMVEVAGIRLQATSTAGPRGLPGPTSGPVLDWLAAVIAFAAGALAYLAYMRLAARPRR